MKMNFWRIKQSRHLLIKKENIIFSIFLMCCLFGRELLANSNFLPQEHITIEEGLSHNGVTSLLEDSRGFIWVGTYDGLNRYDGYTIKKYRNNLPGDFLLSNRIRTLQEDCNRKLWIGTDDGISLLNLENDNVEHLYTYTPERKFGPIIIDIAFYDVTKTVCLAEDAGILLFDGDYNFLKNLKVRNDKEGIIYRDLEKFSDYEYIISTSIGAFLFDVQKEKFTAILPDVIQKCYDVACCGSKQFIAITDNYGINEFSLNDGEFKNEHYLFSQEQFRHIGFDKETNTLWLGAFRNGVVKIDNYRFGHKIKESDVSVFNNDDKQIRISCFLPGVYGSCWIGSYNLGLYRADSRISPFHKIEIDFKDRFALKALQILQVSSYDNQRVLMVSNGGGAAMYNVSSQKFEDLPFKQDSIRQTISAVYKDKNNNIWVGTSSYGLFYCKKGTRELKKVKCKTIPKFNNTNISAIEEDRFGNIWIASSDDIYRFNIDETCVIKHIERLSSNPNIETQKLSRFNFIYCDPMFDILWVGTESSGLYELDITNNPRLVALNSENYTARRSKGHLTSSFITSLIRMPDSTIWLSTEQGGICQMIKNKEGTVFRAFTESDGLSNNVVKTMLYDGADHLWVSTNTGFDKFNIDTHEFRNFKTEDGLPIKVFESSSTQLSDGTMVFGALEGAMFFKADQVKIENERPKVVFDGFKVLNQTINPYDTLNNRVLITTNFTEVDSIQLNYNENVFSFEVSSLHFRNHKNHKIRYRMLPLHHDWIVTTSDNNVINYSGLIPGKYVIELAGSTSNDEWGDVRKVHVEILSPPWKSRWAYIAYLVLGFVSIYLLLIVVLRFSRLRHNLLIEQMEKQKVQEINDEKLKYFINVSHELRTPLTLISAPIDNILSTYQLDAVIKSQLELVRRQSRKMKQLVEQSHDFRKADKDALDLSLSLFSFNQLVKGVVHEYEYLLSDQNKELIITHSDNEIEVVADEGKIEIVINNLLNNAVKFTKPGDKIVVSYGVKNNELFCTVSDSGKGIDDVDLPHIFERFYRSKNGINYSEGSGIGLAFSKRILELHKGSIQAENKNGAEFTFRIPVGNIEQFKNDDDGLRNVIAEEQSRMSSLMLAQKKVCFDNFEVEDSVMQNKVFIVEDNNELRPFLKDTLGRYFKVKAFENGQCCLDALQNEWPDLILSDILMPELNGIELCKKVKTDINTSHIPVVLLTAVTALDKKLEGLGVGADAYINKPFIIEHLIVQISSLLRTRQNLRERFQVDFPHGLEKSPENEKDNRFLEQLYEKMNENLDNFELDMDMLCKEMCINRTHFYHKIKSLTNQTPYELLKSYRLKKAAELLVTEKMTVSEVYIYTGFKSRTHFSKIFKEKYGVSPGKYGKE